MTGILDVIIRVVLFVVVFSPFWGMILVVIFDGREHRKIRLRDQHLAQQRQQREDDLAIHQSAKDLNLPYPTEDPETWI